MRDIIVIGGGPAGMAAALYALRNGKTVLMLESQSIGGQIATSPRVENLPGMDPCSGIELADRMLEQITELGVDFEPEAAIAIEAEGLYWRVLTDAGEHPGRAVIIATGVTHRTLGLEGEKQLLGSGISYCAVCDGAFYRGRTAAVVGGGSTAVQEALLLSRLCEKVYVIYRRSSFHRAEKMSVAAMIQRPNIEILYNTEVKSLLQSGGALTGVELRNTEDSSISSLSIDALFVAVGLTPASDWFSQTIPLDEEGYIRTDENCATGLPGVFAAGDCRKKTVRQLTTAMADGTVAALGACTYLEGIESY